MNSSTKLYYISLLTLFGALNSIMPTAQAANKKPVVKIDKIKPANEQTQIQLNARITDDGSITSTQWEQLSGPSVSLSNPANPQTEFTAPTVKKLTTLKFALTATDDANAATKAQVTVKIKPVNEKPKADAGPDQNSSLGAKITLNGANSSDSDGDIKSWLWKQTAGPKVRLTDAKTSNAYFIAPTSLKGNSASAPLKFKLTVTDDEKGKAFDEVIVTLQKSAALSLDLTEQNFARNDFITPGESKTLTWTVKNASNIDLTNVALTPGTAEGGLTIAAINPAAITNWRSGESQTFSALVSAPSDMGAGSHTQNWSLSYNNGQTLTLNDNKTVAFSLITALPPESIFVLLDNKNFKDGDILSRESDETLNKTLTWTIKNISDTDLTDVVVTPGAATGNLTIGEITPGTVSTWNKGASQTFSVTVSAPAKVGEGTHSQNWSLTYQNGKPLPFVDISKTLSFSVKTAATSCTVPAASAPMSAAKSAVVAYSKIGSRGETLASSAEQWSCVKANQTGLMWENKTDNGGLHDKDWTYSWNDGNSGTTNAGDCGNNKHDCDTASYVQAVNMKGLCGFHDWRVPTDQELLGLVSPNHSDPVIDDRFFSLTQQSMYWSSTADKDDRYAWYVSFGRGYHALNLKSAPRYVRLVRNTQ